MQTTQQEAIERQIVQVLGKDAPTAVAVAKAESGLRPTVINKVGCCVGVLQINRYAHASQIPGATMEEKTSWLQNPANNIRIAKQIFDASGWYPWQAWTNQSYRQFLP